MIIEYTSLLKSYKYFNLMYLQLSPLPRVCIFTSFVNFPGLQHSGPRPERRAVRHPHQHGLDDWICASDPLTVFSNTMATCHYKAILTSEGRLKWLHLQGHQTPPHLHLDSLRCVAGLLDDGGFELHAACPLAPNWKIHTSHSAAIRVACVDPINQRSFQCFNICP